jgi:catechol 2,3-dioxygenase-like lactoylglutathione lyase family enzyme
MIRFDHALIFVTHLAQAVRDYTRLGFTVVGGGAHEGGPTENALVPFADGSYLELIAFRRRRTLVLLRMLGRLRLVAVATRAPLARRFALRAARGPGLIDFALCVDALAPAIETARRSGRAIHGPVPGRRVARDGAPIRWELGVPADEELPLLIADVTPRPLRAAATQPITHANGVTGVTTVVVPVRDADAAAARYRAMLGVASKPDGAAHLLVLGTTRLRLEPASGSFGHPAGLVLGGHPPRRLDVRAAHGAVLDLG